MWIGELVIDSYSYNFEYAIVAYRVSLFIFYGYARYISIEKQTTHLILFRRTIFIEAKQWTHWLLLKKKNTFVSYDDAKHLCCLVAMQCEKGTHEKGIMEIDSDAP